MTEAIFNTLIGVAGALTIALLSNVVQIWLYRKDQKTRAKNEILARRRDLISDLVSCRNALCRKEWKPEYLTDASPSTDLEKLNFNTALNKIPLEFHDKKILGLYQNIGDEFDEIKFYELLEALWKETFNEPFPIPIALISSVPSAR